MQFGTQRANRGAQPAQPLLDLLERQLTHQTGNGQCQLGHDLAVGRSREASLQLDQPVHCCFHVAVVAADDTDIVTVMADR